MVKYFIFVVLNLILTSTVSGDPAPGFCANPVMESENIVDIQFIHDHYKQGWNVQFGNALARTKAAKLLQGTETPEITENPDDICLRATFDLLDMHHMIGSIMGHGLTSSWNCSDDNHVFDCTMRSSKNDYKTEVTLYLVYFDGNENHNVASLALCYPDDTVAWFVLSISKVLSDEETKTILDRFEKLGFDSNSRVPLRSDNCP